VLFKKFDHVAVEFPRLFDLAGVAGTIQDFHLAARDACFERSALGCVPSSLPLRMIVGQEIREWWSSA
jgi:hypothetical protein